MNALESRPPVVFNNLGDEPVHRAIRRLRWFKSSFISQVNSVSEQTDIQFETNTEILARCFLAWLKEFEASKPDDPAERESFLGYASGMMLRRLIELEPVRHLSMPEEFDKSDPAMFWPEGYVYVMYCLNIRKLVADEAFDAGLEFSPAVADISTWWSFRENVGEMSSYAIAFLDLFAGKKPDFVTPYIFKPEDSAQSLPPSSPSQTNQATTRTASRAASRLATRLATGAETQATTAGLSCGLQIGEQNCRAVLVDNSGSLLFERNTEIAIQPDSQLATTHSAVINELLSAARDINVTLEGSSLQGLFVSVPDSLLTDSAEIQSAISANTGVAVSVMSTSTAAAVAEITLGAELPDRNFLLVWMASPIEYRMVVDGKVINDTASTRGNTPAVTDPATLAEELAATVSVLHNVMGLRQVVLAPASTEPDYPQLLGELKNRLPTIDFRYSEVPQTPEAFGAVCLQFIDIVTTTGADRTRLDS